MEIRRFGRGFTLIEMMIVVAILGLLAAVAIPAFVKYIRRSKTTEALMNLRKIFDGSVAYYERDFANRFGARIEKQFPGRTGTVEAVADTPGFNWCCGQVGDKCAPANEPGAWDQQTWQALSFAIDDPHYFTYDYDAVGTARESRFTARANGNLNCDPGQVRSTFERVGAANAAGGVMGGGGIFSKNEVE